MLQPIRYGVPLLALAALVACGEGASTLNESNLSSLAAPSGVEISGTVSTEGSRPALLAFALVEPPAGTDPQQPQQPPSVGVVGDQGEFVLSGVAPGTASVIFLDDAASDGVIDEGDPTAVLTNDALRNLQDGDRVNLLGVHLDFNTQQATVDQVEVSQAGPGAPPTGPAPTPTPAP
jgi:hypothetical protein